MPVPSNRERARILERALQAGVEGDTSAVADLCTDDVTVWTPSIAVASADELRARLAEQDGVFAGVELDVTPLDVGGPFACAEWSATTTSGVTIHGVTVAEFSGDRICSLRQYWDELVALEQLGDARDED
jgi:ketosteroid isomerase-like protein